MSHYESQIKMQIEHTLIYIDTMQKNSCTTDYTLLTINALSICTNGSICCKN